MEKKGILKNIGFVTAGQIAVLGLALIVPRFILTGYGSDTNGLLSTVAQIMSYMAMLEAGIGQATRNELYRYIHGKTLDRENISRVMSVSRDSYRRMTKIYFLCILVLAAVLPLIIKTDLDYLTVFLVTLIEGASGVITFYFIRNHTNLLAVDGKQYINSNIDLLYKVMIYSVKILIALSGIDIVFMELGFLAATIVILIIYRSYMQKRYGWVDYGCDVTGMKLRDRNPYIITEVAWTVFFATDAIVLSVFCSTKAASVYAIYSMVFIAINRVTDAIFTGLKYNLGQLYHDDVEKYKKTHDLFNSVFIGAVSSLLAVAFYLCIPFVTLYTSGISDVDYIDRALPLGFCLVYLLSWYRMVAEHLNGIAGYAKKVSRVSLIEVCINLILSVSLVSFFGIRGVLYATVAALPVKVIYCNLLADKVILKRGCGKTVRILFTNLILFASLCFIRNCIDLRIDSFGSLVLYGVILTSCSVLLFFTANVIANNDLWRCLRSFFTKRKKA